MLDRHDAVVRRELANYGGVEVKTTGDGFLATFDSPSRAVRAALAICEAESAAGVTVRAGLHTGEVERRGDDVAGIGVHVGARVAALAGPSEVLTSATVRDLVLGSEFAFEDRGRHTLKGLDGEFQILAASA
jgi:class 3 adenylate cyclase